MQVINLSEEWVSEDSAIVGARSRKLNERVGVTKEFLADKDRDKPRLVYLVCHSSFQCCVFDGHTYSWYFNVFHRIPWFLWGFVESFLMLRVASASSGSLDDWNGRHQGGGICQASVQETPDWWVWSIFSILSRMTIIFSGGWTPPDMRWNSICFLFCIYFYLFLYVYIYIHCTIIYRNIILYNKIQYDISSTAQGGGGSFKDRAL